MSSKAASFALRVLRTGLDVSANLASNLGAGAIERGDGYAAAIYIAAAAVATAARSTAEHYIPDGADDLARGELVGLVKKYGSLRAALTAIAEEQEKPVGLSRDGCRDLLAFLANDKVETEAHARLEELLLHIGKWMEQHGIRVEEQLLDLRDIILTGMRSVNEQFETARAQSSAQHEELKSLSMRPAQPESSIDTEIELAVRMVKSRQYEAAIQVLDGLRSRETLTKSQRFLVCKWLGKAHGSGRLDSETCSKYYLEAKELQPDDIDALSLEAIAVLNQGHRQRGNELAKALLQRSPRSVRGLVAWIRGEPDATPLSEIEAQIPSDLRANAQIAAAIGIRAAEHGDLKAAEVHSEKAYQADPSDPLYAAQLGQVILGVERNRVQFAADGRTPYLPDRTRIEMAESLLRSALAAFSPKADADHVAHLRAERVTALRLLRHDQEARLELDAAAKAAPSNAYLLTLKALDRQNQKDIDGAIDILKGVQPSTSPPYAVFLLIQLLHERNKGDDHTRGMQYLQPLLRELPSLGPQLSVAVVELATVLAMEHDGIEAALAFLEEDDTQSVHKAALRACASLAYELAGRQDDALRAALEAASAVDDRCETAFVETLAGRLRTLGKPTEACLLLGGRIDPKHLTSITRLYAEVAHQSGLDRQLLSLCEQLRANGIYDARCVELEMRTLARYSAIERAKAVHDEYIARQTSERNQQLARVDFGILAVNAGRPELAETDPALFPHANEVTPELGEAVAHLLSFGAEPFVAVEYAYAVNRRFPGDKASHRAVIRSFLFGVNRKPIIPKPSTIQVDTAVRFTNNGRDDHWVTIENQSPDPSREELSVDHALAVALLGHKPGDTVILRPGAFNEEHIVIREIIHKTVRRLHISMQSWDRMFHGDPFISMASLATKSDGTPDFGVIFRSVDQHAGWLQRLEDWFARDRLPALLFAQVTGRASLDAFQHFCQSTRLRIRTCLGTLEERAAAVERMEKAKGLVFTPSALCLLFITGAFRSLPRLPFPVYVTAGCLADIRRVYLDTMARSDEGGVVAKVQGQYRWIETSPEGLDAYRKSLDEFIGWLSSNVTTVDGLAVADIDPGKRPDEGGATCWWVEAVAYARQEGLLLWEEELAMGELARTEFGVDRVWGQVAIDHARHKLGLTEELWHDYTCQLIAREVSFTTVTPKTIVFAGNKNGWDSRAYPLYSILLYLVKSEAREHDKIRLWAVLLHYVWCNCKDVEADAVTRELMELIATYRNRGVVRAILNSAFMGIPMDTARSAKLWASIRRWMLDDDLRRGWPYPLNPWPPIIW